VVVGLDVAVATDEFDDREVREGSSVRRASGVEHRRTLPRDTLELVEEPRLPDTGVSHDRDGASGAAECPRERLHERAELGLAPDEARQAARGAAFEPGPQRPDAEELIELDRFRYALDARGPERLEVEKPRREGVRPLADDDAARIGQALHALRESDRMADGHHVGVSGAAHDDLPAVEPDADRETGSLLEPQPLGVAAGVGPHAERRLGGAPPLRLGRDRPREAG